MNTNGRTILQAIVAPIFLMGSLFCICLSTPIGPAHAMQPTERPCCPHQHEDESEPSVPQHRPDCPHCGHAQLIKPDGVDAPATLLFATSLPLLPIGAVDALLPPLTAVRTPSTKHLLAGHPPSSILRHKCVLVI